MRDMQMFILKYSVKYWGVFRVILSFFTCIVIEKFWSKQTLPIVIKKLKTNPQFIHMLTDHISPCSILDNELSYVQYNPTKNSLCESHFNVFGAKSAAKTENLFFKSVYWYWLKLLRHWHFLLLLTEEFTYLFFANCKHRL